MQIDSLSSSGNMDQRNRKPASFKIEFPGDSTLKAMLQEKFSIVKQKLRQEAQLPVNNSQVLQRLLDDWLDHTPNSKETNATKLFGSTSVTATKDTRNEKIFLTSSSSLQKCMDVVSDHARVCGKQIEFCRLIRKGHVGLAQLRCTSNHRVNWSSSPRLSNGEFLVDHRMFHGFASSGQLAIHYTRMCEGANIGVIDWRRRNAMLAK